MKLTPTERDMLLAEIATAINEVAQSYSDYSDAKKSLFMIQKGGVPNSLYRMANKCLEIVETQLASKAEDGSTLEPAATKSEVMDRDLIPDLFTQHFDLECTELAYQASCPRKEIDNVEDMYGDILDYMEFSLDTTLQNVDGIKVHISGLSKDNCNVRQDRKYRLTIQPLKNA